MVAFIEILRCRLGKWRSHVTQQIGYLDDISWFYWAYPTDQKLLAAVSGYCFDFTLFVRKTD